MYANDIGVGNSFKWKGDTYVVVREEIDGPTQTIDNLIVVRCVQGYEDSVIADKHRHEENFNPYTDVEPALK
jgi:hypothetical protein